MACTAPAHAALHSAAQGSVAPLLCADAHLKGAPSFCTPCATRLSGIRSALQAISLLLKVERAFNRVHYSCFQVSTATSCCSSQPASHGTRCTDCKRVVSGPGGARARSPVAWHHPRLWVHARLGAQRAAGIPAPGRLGRARQEGYGAWPAWGVEADNAQRRSCFRSPTRGALPLRPRKDKAAGASAAAALSGVSYSGRI